MAEKAILDRNEAAEYIGVSPTVLDKLTRRGQIAFIDFPSSGVVGRPSRKWTKEDLDEFIASHRRRIEPQESAKPVRSRPKRTAPRRTCETSAAAVLESLEA